ncbi:hypothetical protein EV174_001164 [Coemansia sp. RSA 2320]|nr:hypothetical protein EV174_001164 [Coemansia sp. RSA 2320]
MPPFLVYFAQQHEDFRLAELDSLSVLEGVEIEYDPASYSFESPFLVVHVESASQAAKLVRRGILVRHIIEYWGSGETYAEVFDEVKREPERWLEYKHKSFKFTVEGYGRTLAQKEKVAAIESFSFLGFEGAIKMKGAEAEFFVCEEYPVLDTPLAAEQPRRIWFGRVVGQGSRELIDKFDVKKRTYLGNTTMDAELSLVMANQALARAGALVYDPFVGTGSFLLTCSHFGAYSVGSDIDGRQIRGTAGFRRGVNGISANLAQYGLGSRVLDTAVFDICRNPWRSGPLFDAIVTDPPYGVRAGAKRLGRRNGTVPEISLKLVDGVANHRRPDYLPPTVAYEMSDVISDLLEFAAEKLVVGGRLVYWLPTVADEYDPKDLPTHRVFRLVANSEQPFGGWSRRLVTMEKIAPLDTNECLMAPGVAATGDHLPAHRNFRDRYFSKFEPVEDPVEVEGGPERGAALGVRFRVNRLEEGAGEAARAVGTDEFVTVPCGMMLRSIGYASTAVDATAPFDRQRGIVPNIGGRVTDGHGQVVPGLYVAGWVKRGPVGVIATTMQDAYHTGDAILADIHNGYIIGNSDKTRAINEMLARAGVLDKCVTNAEWKRLEAFEVEAGRAAGKPREKVTGVAQMLDIVRK